MKPVLTWLKRLVGMGLVLLVGCDTVTPAPEDILVIEGYLQTGHPLPAITVQQSLPIGVTLASNDAVDDARLALVLDGTRIAYVPSGEAGRYVPEVDTPPILDPYTRFQFEAAWRSGFATAEGAVPPAIALDSIHVTIPARPVSAILIDSLRLDTLGVGAQKGFLYPVEVTLWWQEPVPADTAYWIETRLQPRIPFSSPVIDFFLQPTDIRLETAMEPLAGGMRRWEGLYGIPVDAATSPFPAHLLTVYLIRSHVDYARFAATRDTPERREPATNLEGAAGILAGLALDSLTVTVARPGTP